MCGSCPRWRKPTQVNVLEVGSSFTILSLTGAGSNKGPINVDLTPIDTGFNKGQINVDLTPIDANGGGSVGQLRLLIFGVHFLYGNSMVSRSHAPHAQSDRGAHQRH